MDDVIFNHAATQLVLEVFKANAALLVMGDQMAASSGLSSARWQVLGAIVQSGGEATVSDIGREMGLSRQAVQRVANDLCAQGMVTFVDNPHHKRAKLVRMSAKGQKAFDEVSVQWMQTAHALHKKLGVRNMQQAAQLLRKLTQQL